MCKDAINKMLRGTFKANNEHQVRNLRVLSQLPYVITLPIKKQYTRFTMIVNIHYCLATKELSLYITVWQFKIKIL